MDSQWSRFLDNQVDWLSSGHHCRNIGPACPTGANGTRTFHFKFEATHLTRPLAVFNRKLGHVRELRYSRPGQPRLPDDDAHRLDPRIPALGLD